MNPSNITAFYGQTKVNTIYYNFYQRHNYKMILCSYIIQLKYVNFNLWKHYEFKTLVFWVSYHLLCNQHTCHTLNITYRLAVFWPRWKLSSRIYNFEPRNSFITLFSSICWCYFQQLFGSVCWKQAPPATYSTSKVWLFCTFTLFFLTH